MQGRWNGGARVAPLALCVAVVLAGCGDDDDPPVEDDPSSVATPEIGIDTEETAEPADPVATGDADEPIEPGEPAEPVAIGDPDEPVAPVANPATDPDGDDVPGLVVSGLDGRDPADVVSPWLLNAAFFRSDSNTPGSGAVSIGMLRYEDDFPVESHVDFFAPELDTCRLDRDEPGGDADGDGADQGPPPLISGGPALTINTPAGPWFVLEGAASGDDGTETIYEWDGGLPGPLPDDATLSVPGDAFPNVATFALPDEPAAPIRLLPDEGERPGLDTVYTWVPGDGGDYVGLEFLAFDAASGDFIDFPVVCLVDDDGRFTPPDDARAFLATTADDVRLRYVRVRDTLTLQDGIVFRARTIVAE